MILFEKKNKYGSFNDLMDVSIETGDKWLDKKLNANICYGKGGGGAAPQDVPRTLRPYVTEVLDRAGDVYAPNRKYQQYQGERILGFSDQEQAAQQGIEGMVGRGISATPGLTDASTYYAPALGLLGASTAQQMGASGLLGAISPTLGVSGAQLAQAGQTLGGVTQDIGRFRAGIGSAQQQALQAAEASRAGAGRANINELDIGRYVDPYQQQVIDIEKRQARQDALQAAQAIGAKSAGMGSFGGSRQAILEAQQASDLGTRLADIQTRGSQAAYQQALQTAKEQQQLQYGEDVAGLQRQSALGQALSGLAGQQGQFASQYGQVGSQLGQLSGQQAGIGQAFGDLAGQYGAGAGALGQQAAGLGSLSQAFGALGQQALGQGYREQGYLAGVGEQERGLGQQRADLAYSTFREQEQYPEQQLQRYSSLINAFPYQINQPAAGPSALQQGIGTAVAIGGLGKGLNFFKKGGDIGSGLSGIVYKQEGGTLSSLIDAYDKETDKDKKKKLFDEITAQTNMPKKSSLPEIINPDTKTYLRNIIDSGMGLPKTTGKDTPLSAFGKSIARGAARLPLEALNLPQAALKTYIGAPLDGYINLGEELVTPYEVKESSNINMNDEGFTVADNLEELYRGGDDEMRKRIMATNPQAVATKAKEEGKEVKPIAAAKAEAAPVGSDVVAVAKTSTDLQDLLDKAFAFDRAAEEKAIKQQQGFDIAALGVQLMSTPLNKIDPALISNLGVTNKELAGLDEKEAKKLLQRKLTGLEIKKAEKELNAAGDLVPLPSNVMDLVDAYAGQTAFNKANSNEVQSVVDRAQKIATALSLAEGYEPDSERAASIFRDELQREINEAAKGSGTAGNNPNQGKSAAGVAALPSRQLGLP